MRKTERLLLMLWCSACAWCSAWAAPLDVQLGERILANAVMQLCVTLPQATLSQVQSGQCLPDAASKEGHASLARGVDAKHAFWLLLTLHNSSDKPAERWLQVGHPRLQEVSLFLPDGTRLDSGISTPMAQRAEVPRHYGVLPVTLPEQGTKTVWLRVYSRTLVDLTVTLWTPDAFRESSSLNQLSLALALGSLLAALLYAAMIFVQTREMAYLYFLVAMVGEIALESFRAGFLQRFGWPANLPMPLEIMALASMVGLLGFVAFFFTLVPSARGQHRVFPVYMALVLLTVLAQLWSIVVSYEAAVQIWTQGVYVILVLGIWIIWRAWRGGSRPAGSLLLGFLLMLLPETLRQASVMGWLPFFRVELVSGPWALVFIVPVLFAGLAQRSRELQARLIRSETENQTKVEFLAHMSHELRTPLDTVLGNAQLLARPGNQAMLQEGLMHIQHSGRYLLGMIDEVLDYSRGLAGKLVIQPRAVDWAHFLHQLEHTAVILCSVNNNKFSLHTGGIHAHTLLLDEPRLMQVLNNLLANAARHTHNGTICIECAVNPINEDVPGAAPIGLEFLVSDSGDGIAASDMERIFLPFERGANTGRKGDKGTGMGLTIARQLVVAMGGTLSVTSAPGQGSQFRFWIRALSMPVQETPHPDEAPQSGSYSAYSGARRSVLIVDDHQPGRHVLGKLLQGCGFEVHEASSGNEALRFLKAETQPDLVLTDQLMQDGDGWAVVQACATHVPPIPVVMISALPAQRPAGLSESIQCTVHLLKPIEHSQLLQHMGDLLQLKWVSAAQQEPSKSRPVTQALTPPLPGELAALKSMVEAGQVSEIMRWADALKLSNPNCTRFADEVYVAARFLDFPALQALLSGRGRQA